MGTLQLFFCVCVCGNPDHTGAKSLQITARGAYTWCFIIETCIFSKFHEHKVQRDA